MNQSGVVYVLRHIRVNMNRIEEIYLLWIDFCFEQN